MKVELILTITQILAVAITPFILWGMGIVYQNRKAKRDAKMNLFFTLMRTRKNPLIPRERVHRIRSDPVCIQKRYIEPREKEETGREKTA